MFATGDRVRLEGTVVRLASAGVTVQLADGQAVTVDPRFLARAAETKALRPSVRKVSHAPDGVSN